jgi:hypothetical protein
MKPALFVIMGLFIVLPLYAQYYYPIEKVDTVTFGEWDDATPVILNGSLNYWSNSGDIWLLFTRTTDSSSKIIGKKFNQVNFTWDTTEISLSTTNATEPQRNPEIAEVSYWYTKSRTFRIAAWERYKDSVWNIQYSIYNEDDTTWSAPMPFTADTVDNTGIQMQSYLDSTLIAVWKRKNLLLYSFITPHTISPPETIAVNTTDSIEYDIVSFFSQFRIVWTSRDTAGKNIMLYSESSSYANFSLSPPETLFFRKDAFNPRIVSAPWNKSFTFEAIVNDNREIMVWQKSYPSGHTVENFSNDPLADDYNFQSYTSPVITVPSFQKNTQAYFYFDFATIEKHSRTDTMLIFMKGYYSRDTIQSSGYNRNVCIGSQFVLYNGNAYLLTVWESNRSGRSHIYSRGVYIPWMGVEEETSVLTSFTLEQNYPNPFNSMTQIRFMLRVSGFTTLKVYDVLGREIATLVNERLDSGVHSYLWDAGNSASGMYFYRLQVDNRSVTKKLMLIK